MAYNPFNNLPGKFSTNDGTIDFYLRVRTFLNKKKNLSRFRSRYWNMV